MGVGVSDSKSDLKRWDEGRWVKESRVYYFGFPIPHLPLSPVLSPVIFAYGLPSRQGVCSDIIRDV